MDALDRATMTAYAVNAPKELDARRSELRARLRNDPRTPTAPRFTREEMQAAVQKLMAKNWKTSNTIQ